VVFNNIAIRIEQIIHGVHLKNKLSFQLLKPHAQQYEMHRFDAISVYHIHCLRLDINQNH